MRLADGRRAALLPLIAREAMAVACEARRVTINDVMSKGRSRAAVAYARQIAMYLAHVIGGMTLSEISVAFKRDRSTVSHACHMIEDRRDRPPFDRRIEALERELRARLRGVYSASGLATRSVSRRLRSRRG